MTKLTNDFTYEEVVKSATADKYGIDNTPNASQLQNIIKLLDYILLPVRNELACPIIVNSIFRSKELNKRIKGAVNSQHMANNGAAADIECPKLGNKKLFDTIKNNYNFDQLIWEFGDSNNPDWVHVSYVSPESNRHSVLKAFRDSNGKTRYINI